MDAGSNLLIKSVELYQRETEDIGVSVLKRKKP
jgi:hypothetical protein